MQSAPPIWGPVSQDWTPLGGVHPSGSGLTPLLSTASAGRGGCPFPLSRAGFGRLTLHVPPGLALAFHDGSVHIVHRLSLQTMAIFYSSAAPRSVDEPAIKRPRTTGPAVHFKAMQLSWTSLALAGIDNHGRVSAGPGGLLSVAGGALRKWGPLGGCS